MGKLDLARDMPVRSTYTNYWAVWEPSGVGQSTVAWLPDENRYWCGCGGTKPCVHVLAVIMYRQAEDEELTELVDDANQQHEVEGAEVEGAELEQDEQAVGVPAPNDPMFADDLGPLPDWVANIRPHQWQAVQDARAAFDAGADIVVLDAPTGTGKTLVAELIRRELQLPALYVCSDKGLQDQFMVDFSYAKVLKGRSNYPTQRFRFPQFTAGDCVGEGCLMCDNRFVCPYQRAKTFAQRSRLAVLNTSYLLTAANHAKAFNDNQLVVVDECDTLESMLMGFVEFRVGEKTCRELGVEPPKKGSHKTTIATWIADVLVPAVTEKLKTIPKDAEHARDRVRFGQLQEDGRRIHGQLGEDAENWLRDYEKNKDGSEKPSLILRPVRVDDYGHRYLWKHSRKWLLMSASVISTEEMVSSLGMGELDVQTVRVPMTFPVENRQIKVAPVADMARDAATNGAWIMMARAIGNVLKENAEHRVLVHCVSYKLAHFLREEVPMPRERQRFSYGEARAKAGVLEDWRRSKAGVMFAPSLDRGVDLKGDDCRVQIIAKIPFPYLGDPQVSARMHGTDGGLWYATQTVRTIVQMTGRAVRSEDDWAVTYMLDSQFMSNIWRKHKMLFPKWWRDAVDTAVNTRELMA